MKDSAADFVETFHIGDPKSVQEASSQLKSTLDTKYEKANFCKVAESANHLSKSNRNTLHATLKEYSNLFNRTLGKWNMGAYDIEIRPEATPYHARAFLVPKAYTNTLKLEVDWLEKVGVLKGLIVQNGWHPHLSSWKGWFCEIHFGFQRTQQTNQKEAFSYT